MEEQIKMDFDQLIDNFLRRDFRSKTIGRYYPSEVGGCLRKTWFSYKKPKQVNPDLRKIFEAGNRLHSFVAEVLDSDKNKHIELLDSEIPIKIEEQDFLVSGRIDNLILVKIENKKILVEVKSTKFLPEKPYESHIMQLQLYLHATWNKNGALLYIQKDNLKSKWFDIVYDEQLVHKIIERFRKLHESLIKNEVPDPEAKNDENISWMCKNCNYFDECNSLGEQ